MINGSVTQVANPTAVKKAKEKIIYERKETF